MRSIYDNKILTNKPTLQTIAWHPFNSVVSQVLGFNSDFEPFGGDGFAYFYFLIFSTSSNRFLTDLHAFYNNGKISLGLKLAGARCLSNILIVRFLAKIS